MVLGNDLYSRQGRLLLPEGAVIEEKHLRIFKIWGVDAVDVRDAEAVEARLADFVEIDPHIFQKADDYLGPWFLHSGLSQEPMQEIYRHCLLKVAQHCAKTGVMPKHDCCAGRSPEAPLSLPTVRKKIDLDQLIRKPIPLASFPDAYQRINDLLHSPRSSAKDVAQVVECDTALATKLLQLVNSPLYGFPSQVESITHAVALLGGNELCTLMIGISAASAFKDIPMELYDMRTFWLHSTACAIMARLLAVVKTGLSDERFFVAGLLHDVGLLFLLQCEPQLESNILRYAQAHKLPLDEVERDVLGFDHSSVGGALLEKWRFPESLTHTVRHHHTTGEAIPITEQAIIHVAESLATAFNCCEGQCAPVQQLHSKAWQSLDLSPASLGTIMEQAKNQIHVLRNIFFY